MHGYSQVNKLVAVRDKSISAVAWSVRGA